MVSRCNQVQSHSCIHALPSYTQKSRNPYHALKSHRTAFLTSPESISSPCSNRLALEHCRTWDLVRFSIIDRVFTIVGAGERYQPTRMSRAAPCDLDLVAAWVELRTGILGSIVQSNQLMTDDIAAVLQTRWNRVRVTGVVGYRQGCDAPSGVCALAVLCDFEPNGVFARHVASAVWKSISISRLVRRSRTHCCRGTSPCRSL